MNNTYQFKATPMRILYYNNDSYWGAVQVWLASDRDMEDNEIPYLEQTSMIMQNGPQEIYTATMFGSMQELNVGMEYKVTAMPKYNKKYNEYQYEVCNVESSIPLTIQDQHKFLRSIITERQADTLLSKYPHIVEDVVNNNDYVELDLLKGIGESTWTKIKEKILNNYVVADIVSYLRPVGVSFKAIRSMLEYEKNPQLLKQKIMDNPYMITMIDGFGFKRVDPLVLELKPELKVSKIRLEECINYYLKEMAHGSGHTWLTIADVHDYALENVPECMEYFDDVIKSARENERYRFYEDKGKICLRYYHFVESEVMTKLDEINNSEIDIIDDDTINRGISIAEDEQNEIMGITDFAFTSEQRDVIIKSVNAPISIITGKAGVGKGVISSGLLNIYKLANKRIACCALSAKAAIRITEATGFPAKTIHRLLGCKGLDKFGYDRQNHLPIDVLLVDECSMINANLFMNLLVAVENGIRVILIGDNGQLPPIGYGNIFNDILNMKNKFNINTLTKVMRQAEQSGILSNANMIREGINPISQPEFKIVTGELQDMTYMFRDEMATLNQIAVDMYCKVIERDKSCDDIVIITPRKKGCINCTSHINEQIQQRLIPPTAPKLVYGDKNFSLGTKVIQRANNYQKNVFNGEIGYITKVDTKEKKLEVTFKLNNEEKVIEYEIGDLLELDLAYAITIHLSQGSGYKNVIVIMDNSHYMMADNCILYTALTRAKKRCLLLAQPSAYKKCINTNFTADRQTWLSLKKN